MRRGAVALRTSKQMSPNAADHAKGAVRKNAAATHEQIAVIVGAGLAGGNAAVILRQEKWRGRIVLLGAEPGIPVGRPPLSKTYLRGEEDLSAWYIKPATATGTALLAAGLFSALIFPVLALTLLHRGDNVAGRRC
jgi:predicted NAD/FAD-dependent oxidoreductase